MNRNLEARRDSLLISTDPALLDMDAICSLLGRAFWAQGRPRERIEKSVKNSLVFGVYDNGRQIGLARVITDCSTFAWLDDVFLNENYRGRGIGKWLMETILSHPDLLMLRRFLLITRDAHGLYRQYGFTALHSPDRMMERLGD